MKRALIIIFLVLGLIVLYFNRSYAHIFNLVGEKNLSNPTTESETLIGGMPAFRDYHKILFLGDSLTAGVGASDSQKTYWLLVGEYQSGSSVRMMKLSNLAQPGATSADLFNDQLGKGIAFDPNEIFILIGINDMHNLVPLNDFSRNLKNIVQNFVGTNRTIHLINLPYLGITQSPYQTYFDWQTKRYNKVIKQVAEEFQLKLIDIYTPTVNKFKNDPSLYSSDLFHPNDSGYQLIADEIIRQI